MDVYMDNYILSESEEHQKLIGLTCLLLAAKSEDLDELVPSIKDLLNIVDMSHDLHCNMKSRYELEKSVLSQAYKEFSSLCAKLEFLIFESIEFNTVRPTVVTFLNILQNIIVSDEDTSDIEMSDEDDLITLGDLRTKANEYIIQYLDVVIADTDFFNLLPSQIAAAIIGATRKNLNIQNYWNPKIVFFTRYEIDEILPLINVLTNKHFDSVFQNLLSSDFSPEDEAMKDSGFVSPSLMSDDSVSQTEDEGNSQKSSPVTKKRRLMDRAKIIYCAWPN